MRLTLNITYSLSIKEQNMQKGHKTNSQNIHKDTLEQTYFII